MSQSITGFLNQLDGKLYEKVYYLKPSETPIKLKKKFVNQKHIPKSFNAGNDIDCSIVMVKSLCKIALEKNR